MLETNFTICPGALLAALAWVAAVALFGVGWFLSLEALRDLGAISALVGGVLLVMLDNARTRRVVRAVQRESVANSGVRSL